MGIRNLSTASISTGAKRSKFWDQSTVLTGNYEAIASNTLTSTASSVTFTSIPSTYKHLEIRGVARHDYSAWNQPIFVTVNSDTATNYGSQGFINNYNGLGFVAYYDNAAPCYYAQRSAGASSPSNYFGGINFSIIDYAKTNKSKIFLSEMGGALSGTSSNNWAVSMAGGHWRNTNAITSITLSTQNGSFVAGTRFSLYGIS